MLRTSKRSNCTFMELKSRSCRLMFSILFCSNCTFMELKWAHVITERLNLSDVLIVPLWN